MNYSKLNSAIIVNVSCFLEKEEVIEKIFEFNFDYEKMVCWIEDHM